MGTVVLRYEAITNTDMFPRYFGRAVDGVLNADFWTTQPALTLGENAWEYRDGVLYGVFGYEETVDLEVGVHTIAFGNSGYCHESGVGTWEGRISVNGVITTSGCIGRDEHLITQYTVTPAVRSRFVTFTVS